MKESESADRVKCCAIARLCLKPSWGVTLSLTVLFTSLSISWKQPRVSVQVYEVTGTKVCLSSQCSSMNRGADDVSALEDSYHERRTPNL